MVACFWGHRVDLAAMRRRFSISLKGSTLKGLVNIANSLSLKARPLKLSLGKLAELRLPCILHWDMSHFVVLKSLNSRQAVIHDPAAGERRMSIRELSTHFTGIALELTPGPEFTRVEERRPFTLTGLMGRVVGMKRGLMQLLLMGIALQICALITPFYMQWVIDDALVAGDRDLVTVLGVGFLPWSLFKLQCRQFGHG
jgi:ATP-binding cassette subfamily B protein RaxB